MEGDGRKEEAQSPPECAEGAGHGFQAAEGGESPPEPQPQRQSQPPEPRKRARSKWFKVAGVSLAFAAVAGGCFVGGMEYGESRRPAEGTAAVAAPGTRDGASGRQDRVMPGGPMAEGMRGVMGEVTKVGSSSITVEDARTGEAATYVVTDSTEILEGGEEAEIGDIGVGDTVMVVASSDDEKVAERIVIDPGMGGPGGQDMANPSGRRDATPSS